jgi:hypothetical protein
VQIGQARLAQTFLDHRRARPAFVNDRYPHSAPLFCSAAFLVFAGLVNDIMY